MDVNSAMEPVFLRKISPDFGFYPKEPEKISFSTLSNLAAKPTPLSHTNSTSTVSSLTHRLSLDRQISFRRL